LSLWRFSFTLLCLTISALAGANLILFLLSGFLLPPSLPAKGFPTVSVFVPLSPSRFCGAWSPVLTFARAACLLNKKYIYIYILLLVALEISVCVVASRANRLGASNFCFPTKTN
jgi:hypothetical protein